jgi:hypothetical protein
MYLLNHTLRPGVVLIRVALFIVVLAGSLLPWGEPLQAQSGITSPATGAAISGDVPIFGTAVIDPFQKYELHYKLEPSGDDAYIYFYGNTVPVTDAQLGVWQAGGLAPGIYSLRLRVVKNDGNYAEYFTHNLSVNQSAVTPTPEVTPTPSEPTPTPIPTMTFTPAPQPTPVVGQVAQPPLGGDAAQPAAQVAAAAPDPNAAAAVATTAPAEVTTATVTLADVTTSTASAGSVTRELGEALSLTRLRTQFFNGMRFTAALFFGVVAIYAGKRLFDWVWKQYS